MRDYGDPTKPCAVANSVIALRLQFTCPVGWVGELGLLGASVAVGDVIFWGKP